MIDRYEKQTIEMTRSAAEEKIFTVLNRQNDTKALCDVVYEIAQKLGFK